MKKINSSRAIAVFGYYGFGNAGDECILQALVSGLYSADPKIRISVASATPELTASELQVQSFLWSDASAVQQAVDWADLVLVGGGGLFHDYYGFDPNAFLTDQQTGIAYYASPAILAALQAKPAILCSVGVGPLYSGAAKTFTRAAADAALLVTVRDEESRTILIELGVAPSKISVTADLAFSYFPLSGFEASVPKIAPRARPVAGVSLRPWSHGIAPSHWEREVASALDLWIERNEGNVLFIPFQNLPGTTEDDASVIERVRAAMRQSEHTSSVAHTCNARQILSTLHRCDLVLAMRLHAAILGACANKPVVAIGYDAKVVQAMTRLGAADRVEDLYAISAGALVERLESASLEGVRAVTRNALGELRQAAAATIEGVVDRLKLKTFERAVQPGAYQLLARSVRSLLQRDKAANVENRRLVDDIGTTMGRVRELEGQMALVESERARAESLGVEVAGLSHALESSEAIRDRTLRDQRVVAEHAEEIRAGLEQRGLSLASEITGLHSELTLSQDRVAALQTALQARQAETVASISEVAMLQSARNSLLLRIEILEFEAGAHAAMEIQWAAERQAFKEERLALQAVHQRLESANFDLRTRMEATEQAAHLRAVDYEESLSRRNAALDRAREHEADKLREFHRTLAETRRNWKRLMQDTADAVTDSVRRFEADFEAGLDVYRNQRAWQLMLLTRKAYDLAVRGGWTGGLQAVALGAKTLARAPLQLAAWDLRFPSVWNYLPQRIFDAPPETEESPLTAAPSAAIDIVLFPVFDFEFRFQRPQQIATELARRGHRVFWVSPTRRAVDKPLRYGLIPLRENLFEVQIESPGFDLYGGALQPGDEDVAVESLRQLYRNEGIAESGVVIQFPFWRRFALPLRREFGAKLLYDKMDDWEHWPTEPRISAFNLDEEQSLMKECDSLVVTAREMAQRYRHNLPLPRLIANGADFEFFHKGDPHPALSALQKPVIGYYGAIAPWFNLELLIDLAKQRPHFTFVLIGAVHGIDIGPLRELPNVHLPGEKNYRELPAYLAGFDVCLIPFRINALTNAVDPVKMYEYCSQGKPVISSPMPEILHLDTVIRFASDTPSFLRAIDDALGEKGTEQREKRIAFARENTWGDRTSAFQSAFRDSYPSVSIVVLTHNSAPFLRPCYESIRRNTRYPNYELILVDNASTDGTPEILREIGNLDSDLRVLQLAANIGFAAGNNRGVDISTGEFVVLLNADTIATQGWLHRLLRPLLEDKDCGMSAPVTNHSGNETKIDFDYRDRAGMESFAASRAREFAGQTLDVPMAPLLCGAFRKSLWNTVGPLDDQFEIGMFEDDDFSLRIRQANLRIVTAEDCFIHHFGSGSFQQLDPSESLRIFDVNRKRFEAKWGRPWTRHSYRPGVRPVNQEVRFTPDCFELQPGEVEAVASPCPTIVRLMPDTTVAGLAMNRQPDGNAALVLECLNATPDSIVEWDSRPLQTAFANESFISAIVPANCISEPGEFPVRLTNYFGASKPIFFRVSE